MCIVHFVEKNIHENDPLVMLNFLANEKNGKDNCIISWSSYRVMYLTIRWILINKNLLNFLAKRMEIKKIIWSFIIELARIS